MELVRRVYLWILTMGSGGVGLWLLFQGDNNPNFLSTISEWTLGGVLLGLVPLFLTLFDSACVSHYFLQLQDNDLEEMKDKMEELQEQVNRLTQILEKHRERSVYSLDDDYIPSQLTYHY